MVERQPGAEFAAVEIDRQIAVADAHRDDVAATLVEGLGGGEVELHGAEAAVHVAAFEVGPEQGVFEIANGDFAPFPGVLVCVGDALQRPLADAPAAPGHPPLAVFHLAEGGLRGEVRFGRGFRRRGGFRGRGQVRQSGVDPVIGGALEVGVVGAGDFVFALGGLVYRAIDIVAERLRVGFMNRRQQAGRLGAEIEAEHLLAGATQLDRVRGAGAEGFGGAFIGIGRQHDGALVDQGAHRIAGRADDKIGAAHADRRDWRVEAEPLPRRARGVPGDRPGNTFFEVELDRGQRRIAAVVFVAHDLQAAVGPDADQGVVDKADMDVAVRFGADEVPGAHRHAHLDAPAFAAGGVEPGAAKHHAHLAGGGLGRAGRRRHRGVDSERLRLPQKGGEQCGNCLCADVDLHGALLPVRRWRFMNLARVSINWRDRSHNSLQ